MKIGRLSRALCVSCVFTVIFACSGSPPPVGPSGFADDVDAGTRTYGVGYGGDGQWMADVDGNGRADLVYNKDGSHEYRVLLAGQGQPYGDGLFAIDKFAGSRNSNNNVGYSGKAQWMADVNGDGRADYVYNRDNKHEYWVMLAKSDGTFQTDMNAGSRDGNNNVGYGGNAQWMADVNGDGRADYVYNRDNKTEYWVMLADSDGTFQTDMNAGSRSKDVGFGGDAQWMADVNGDGRADFVYNEDGTTTYRVMLGQANGTFGADAAAGDRASNNDVGYGGDAQWLSDVSGDGRADFVYNRNKTKEYWVMVARPDGSFETDSNWGALNANNDVGYGIYGQGFADLNGDGRMDFCYNRNDTHEYWAMLSLGDSFHTDRYWGSRSSNNNVGFGGMAQWLIDVDGDGLADYVYNRDNYAQYWVMASKRPPLAATLLLDVWGEGYIVETTGVSGFQDSMNLNKDSQKVSSGANTGKPIPALVSVTEFEDPVFPVADGAVEVMTSMNADISEGTAQEMHRTIDKNNGTLVLYDPAPVWLDRIGSAFVGWYDVTADSTLDYPYDLPSGRPYYVFRPVDEGITLSLGKGARIGGVGRSDSAANESSGGGTVHDEL